MQAKPNIVHIIRFLGGGPGEVWVRTVSRKSASFCCLPRASSCTLSMLQICSVLITALARVCLSRQFSPILSRSTAGRTKFST
jgi:hypothetical protein